MCLSLKNGFVKSEIAENNIIVYKIIKQLDDGSYETPYRHSTIEIGETYESKLIRRGFYIDDGLHSFETFEDTKNERNCFISKYVMMYNTFPICHIVRCVIPKGAEYYKGTFGIPNGTNSYASSKIKYVDIID